MARTQTRDMAALQSRVLKKKSNDKGGGSKKYGRNRAKCATYRINRSYKNKLAKIRKHINQHPNDGCAIRALRVAQVAF